MSVLFLCECYTETLIYSHLLLGQTNSYTHKRGVTAVLKDMQSPTGKYSVLIGCIDNDKHLSFAYFSEFKPTKKAHDITLLKHKSNENKVLIQLNPAAETWLLQTAKSAGINPEGFSLPTTPDKLKNFSTIGQGKNQTNLKNFIKAIFASGNERSEFLKSIVESYFPKPDWVK